MTAINSMIPHVVTLYTYNGKDASNKPQYVVTVLCNVYYREAAGVSGMYNAADHAVVHIFDDSVIAIPGDGTVIDRSLYELSGADLERANNMPDGEKPYLDERTFDAAINREQYWTIHGDGKDFIAKGDTSRMDVTLAQARRITSVRRVDVGSRRMWGWKVIAQ